MLNTINLYASKKRQDEDNGVFTGEAIANAYDGSHPNNSGIFLLFRGVQMREEWIESYDE